jgi:hypothetical protein
MVGARGGVGREVRAGPILGVVRRMRLALLALVLAACQHAQSSSDAGLGSCQQASQCIKSHPDECNICADTRLVCVDQQCQCTCTAHVDAGVGG